MTKEEELKETTKCLTVEGKGINKKKLECPKGITTGGNPIKQLGDDCDDFYARLRNMYNKTEAPVTESKERTQAEVLSEIEENRKILTSDAKKIFKSMQRGKTEGKKSFKSSYDKIRYMKNENDDVECESTHYDKKRPNPSIDKNQESEFIKNIGGPESSFWEGFGEKFPTIEELPKDHDELEQLFFRYVDRLGALADSMQRKHPNPEPGTEESVLSYEYKLDPPRNYKNPTEAVIGERKCTCTETVEIDGDTAELVDIKKSVKELKSNHKVGAVLISVSKKDQVVDESVDSSTKLKEMKGPVLMTKYALEFLSCKISKHPCLESITFKNVPLSSSVQAMLIPSFANLAILKLVSAKLKDGGIKKLSQYLWRSKILRVIDFTDNGITKHGAERVANLIEKKGMCKTMDPDHLPLERVTLNNNPIGTEGMKSILKALQIDFFMKAVDLRDCDIVSNSDEILDIIIQNLDLQILDLRGNNIQRLDLVIKNILQNRSNEETTYKWEDEEEILKYMDC